MGVAGQTPVLRYHSNWKMLCGDGRNDAWNSYFRLFSGAVRSPQIILFPSRQTADRLGRLAPHYSRPGGSLSATSKGDLAVVSSGLRPRISSRVRAVIKG